MCSETHGGLACSWLSPQREVAVKERTVPGEEACQQTRTEYELLARLSHPSRAAVEGP